MDNVEEVRKQEPAEKMLKCQHKGEMLDEPPQCADCGVWICGVCRSALFNSVGLCIECIRDVFDIKD